MTTDLAGKVGNVTGTMALLAAGAVSKMGGEAAKVSLATARRAHECAPEKGVTVSGTAAKNELTAVQRQAHFLHIAYSLPVKR